MLDVPCATCYARRMLRIAILVGLLSACGGGGNKGPAWPKSSSDGPDGGESLAPRVASPLAANELKDDDKDDDDDKSSTKDDAKTDDDKSETSKGTSPTVTAPEDVINLDDLVIEVDD